MAAGPHLSSLLFYAKVFVISGIVLGVFFHAVTKERMPWWPDTAIMGAFMGALAVLIAIGRRHDRRAVRHMRNAARATRLWWRARNSV